MNCTKWKLPLLIIWLVFSLWPAGLHAADPLTFVNRHKYGEGGIYGLAGATGIALSPDKRHVYTTAASSMSVFSYDTLTGNLTFLKTYLDNEDGFNGLYRATCIVVSKDNKNVYVSSENSPNYLSVFDRDSMTGLLTIRHIMNEAPVLLGAYGMELTDDNRFLYITSWNSQKVSVYARDTMTGDLTWLQSAPGNSWPESIKLSVDNRYIYVTSFINNSIIVYQRDSLGLLTTVQTVTHGTGGVQGLYNVRVLAVSGDNRFLYSAGSNSIAVFSRNVLTGNLAYVTSYTDNVGGIDGINQTFSMAIPPDSKSLHVITSGDSSLTTFLRDTATGTLAYVNSIKMANNLYPPLNIYSTSSLFATNTEIAFTWYWGFCIKTFHRDPVTAALSFHAAYTEGQGVVTTGLKGAIREAVTADKKAVYVSTPFNGISILSRNDTLGALSFQSNITEDSLVQGLTGARDILATPDNKFIYVAGNYEDAIVVFARDQATNNLSYVTTVFNNQNGVTGLDGVTSLAISPDAKFIYAGSEWNSAVVAFAYDSSSGALTFVQKIDLFTIVGLSVTVDKVKVSADGNYLFAPGWDDGFFMFRRNILTGQLTFLDWYRYYGLTDGDISADMKNVYAINPQFNQVLSFSIDPSQDTLYLVQVLTSDSDHLELPKNPGVLSISKDDRFVYVTSKDSNSVTMFQRRMDGKLEYVNSFKEDHLNFEGLDGISSVSYSPDNKNVYFTSSVEGGITAYKTGAFLGNDLSACAGDTLTLTPGDRYSTYLWSTGDTSGTIKVTANGIYSVSVTDEYGFQEQDTIAVYFNPLPVVFLGTDTIICPGTDILLQAGNSFISYAWNTGDTTPSVSVPGGAVYSLLVEDSNECRNSDTISIALFQRPAVDLGPDTSVCDNALFSLSPDTAGNFIHFLWITGDTTQSLRIWSSGSYSVTVTDSNTCTNSDTAVVTVYASPLIYLGPDTILHINQSLKLGQYGFSNYVWSTGDTIPKITINQSSFTTDSLMVWVQVSNLHCTSSDTLHILLDSTYAKDYFRMIDTNKVWTIAECSGPNTCGTTVLHFNGDTLIAGNLYKKLVVNQDSGGVGTVNPLAVREDTSAKKVFFYSATTEYLAYDFSLTQGDLFSTVINGCIVQNYVVFNGSVTLLNGEIRKIIYLTNGEAWIEGVGSSSGLPYSGLNSCVSFIADLNCFIEDDTLKFHNLSFPTCYFRSVGVQDLDFESRIQVYPNPFSEFTTLQFENPTSGKCNLSVYDMKGCLMMEYNNIVSGKVEIKRGSLECGVYFARIQTEEREYIQKIVVQ